MLGTTEFRTKPSLRSERKEGSRSSLLERLLFRFIPLGGRGLTTPDTGQITFLARHEVSSASVSDRRRE